MAIDISKVKSFCKDDISLIEGYDEAISSNECYACHHRLEFTLDNEFAHTRDELIRLGMYYKRPYFELIFMKDSEHSALHRAVEWKASRRKRYKGWNPTNEQRTKMSLAHKGKSPNNKGIPRSEFGIKFFKKFGKTLSDDVKLYNYHMNWYRKHNKTCKWEA